MLTVIELIVMKYLLSLSQSLFI